MYLDELNRQREKYQTEGNILKEIKILREILAETEKQYGIESDEYIEVTPKSLRMRKKILDSQLRYKSKKNSK